MELPKDIIAEDFGRVFELIAGFRDKNADPNNLVAERDQICHTYVWQKGYTEPEVRRMFFIAEQEYYKVMGRLAVLTPEDIIEKRL